MSLHLSRPNEELVAQSVRYQMQRKSEPEKYQSDKHVRGGLARAYLGGLCVMPPPLRQCLLVKKKQN